MPHIPDDFILRAVEYTMKRNRKLNHAEIGREMPSVLGNNGNNIAAELAAQFQKLRLRHIFYIQRTGHPV